MTETKMCHDCNYDKPVTEFYPYRAGGAIRRNFCKVCERERQRRWYRNRKKRGAKKVEQKPDLSSGKRCSGCELWLPATGFDRDPSSRDGRHSRCKRCRAEANRRYVMGGGTRP